MKIYFRHKLCIYICFSHTMHISFDFIFKFLLLEKYRPAIKYEMSPVTPYTMNITPKNNINDEMKWHTWYILQQKTATPYIGSLPNLQFIYIENNIKTFLLIKCKNMFWPSLFLGFFLLILLLCGCGVILLDSMWLRTMNLCFNNIFESICIFILLEWMITTTEWLIIGMW